MLAEDWGVAADIWSVTSWNELARDGVAAEQWNLLHPGEAAAHALRHRQARRSAEGPVVAVSDYMRAVPLRSRRWVPGRLPRARRRRVRLRRHPPGRPALLPDRRAVGRRPGPPGPRRRAARSSPRWSQEAFASTASTTRPRSADVKQEGGDA